MCYLAELQLQLQEDTIFLVSGYDFKAPENYPKDAAQGREALFDGLCWKLLPTLLYHSYYRDAEWHIILEDDCEITVQEGTVPNLFRNSQEQILFPGILRRELQQDKT